MIETQNVSVRFGSRTLYDNVNLKFTDGNCYGLIGANGAGKSTFLRVLSGELKPRRISVKQTVSVPVSWKRPLRIWMAGMRKVTRQRC